MNALARRGAVPSEAFKARPITSDPAMLDAYFSQVASYEANRLRSAERKARAGFVIGALGLLAGVAGCLAVLALSPLKTVTPLVFRVDNTTGVVERVHDVQGGQMPAREAERRYFLWQYVRLRQSYTQVEAKPNFEAVTLMSSPQVQQEYSGWFRGSNRNSPQVVLGRDGSASLSWVSTTFLGPQLAQVRFVQNERKGDTQLPAKRLVATVAYDFAPGQVSSSTMNVNPLGFVVTSYRVDTEVVQ